MTQHGTNRMANPTTRQQGRPKKSETRASSPQLAIVDATLRHVPPLTCPCCGRGNQPRVERWRPSGSADCICQANGCRFTYTPAQVAPKQP